MKNLVAYCKRYYPWTNNIWADLKSALVLDGYSEDMSNNDVFIVVINKFKSVYDTYYLDCLLLDLDEKSCYLYGYFTKGNCNLVDKSIKSNKYPNYDYRRALLYYIRNYICFIESEKLPKEVRDFLTTLKSEQ